MLYSSSLTFVHLYLAVSDIWLFMEVLLKLFFSQNVVLAAIETTKATMGMLISLIVLWVYVKTHKAAVTE